MKHSNLWNASWWESLWAFNLYYFTAYFNCQTKQTVGSKLQQRCANYLNHIYILASTSPFVSDNYNISAGFLFFGQGKQLIIFWSVGISFENCEVKMGESMKSDGYQDQSQPSVGQRNGKPLWWFFLHLKNKCNTGTKIEKHTQCEIEFIGERKGKIKMHFSNFCPSHELYQLPSKTASGKCCGPENE